MATGNIYSITETKLVHANHKIRLMCLCSQIALEISHGGRFDKLILLWVHISSYGHIIISLQYNIRSEEFDRPLQQNLSFKKKSINKSINKPNTLFST